MIVTLFTTVIIEGVVVLIYCLWQRKSIPPLLLTGFAANLITQPCLWIVLDLFFQHYLLTLLIAETGIWIIESLFLYAVPANRLRFTEAIVLSLIMNLASFGLGWFLPI